MAAQERVAQQRPGAEKRLRLQQQPGQAMPPEEANVGSCLENREGRAAPAALGRRSTQRDDPDMHRDSVHVQVE